MIEGICIKRFNDGNLSQSTEYKNGYQNGNQIIYDKNGKIIEIIKIVNNIYKSYTKYYNNGNIKIYYECDGSIKQGKYEEFFENGNKKIICNYKDNKLNGLYQEYYQNEVLIKNN